MKTTINISEQTYAKIKAYNKEHPEAPLRVTVLCEEALIQYFDKLEQVV